MADTKFQTLTAFIKESKKENIQEIIGESPWNLLAVLQQGEETQKIFNEALATHGVDRATLMMDEDELKRFLGVLFRESFPPLTEGKSPIIEITPNTISRAQRLEESHTTISTALNNPDRVARITTYARQCVGFYVDALALQHREEVVNDAVKAVLETRAQDTPEQTRAAIRQALQAKIAQVVPQAKLPASQPPEEDALAYELATIARIHEVSREILRHPEVRRPDVMAENGVKVLNDPNRAIAITSKDLETLLVHQAHAAAVFEATIDPSAPPSISFQSVAQGAIQKKIFAPLADLLYRGLPEAKETVIQSIVAKGWSAAAKQVQEIDKFQAFVGESAAASDIFQQFLQNSQQSMGDQQQGAKAALSGLGNLANGVVGSVFTKPPTEMYVAYMAEVHKKIIEGNHPPSASLFQLVYMIGYMRSPQAYTIAPQGGAGGSFLRAAGGEVARSSLLSLLRGALAGAGEGAVASGASSVLTGGSSLAVGAVAGLLKGALNKAINVLTGLQPGKGESLMSPYILAPAACIGVILFVFVLLFLPASPAMVTNFSQPVAIVDSYGVGGQGIPLPEYTGRRPEKASDPLGCPVDDGRITQGPYEGPSHGNVDAYDFGSQQGTEVRATHDGIVAKALDGVPLNQFCEGGSWCSFGNFVRLVGKNSNGEEFFTTYAHMMPGLNVTTNQEVKRQEVKRGDVLGYVDATGYTFGPDRNGERQYGGGTHLHYQYDGPGELALPAGCGGTSGTRPPSGSACTTTDATQKILAIGDSITTPGGYPRALQELIDSKRLDATIDSISFPTKPPADMIGGAKSRVTSLAPDIILIHAGTNTVNSDPDGDFQGLKDLIATVRSANPRATIYVARIIKRYDKNGLYISDIQNFNQKVDGLTGVQIVNMENLVTLGETTDGIHPTETGYMDMANAWLSAIQGTLSSCTQPR